jgi:hypothetical protein
MPRKGNWAMLMIFTLLIISGIDGMHGCARHR